MLLIAEKGIWGGMCHAIYYISKADDKYMKDYDKNKKKQYHKYWNVNDLEGCARSKKLPVNGFM